MVLSVDGATEQMSVSYDSTKVVKYREPLVTATTKAATSFGEKWFAPSLPVSLRATQ
jgi:hypothetical protein